MYDRGNMQAAAFYTEKSRETEDARRQLIHYYNKVICGGKWNGILDPEGFPPPRAAMMPICTPPLKIEGDPSMRVDIWNDGTELCFASPGEKWIDIGNTGTGGFTVGIEAPGWTLVSEKQVRVSTEKRILVCVSDVSENRHGKIRIKNMDDNSVRDIPVRTVRPACDAGEKYPSCAQEEDGMIVLEGSAWDPSTVRGQSQESCDFKVIRRLGRMQGDLVEACVQREPKELDSNVSEAKPLQYSFYTHGRPEGKREGHSPSVTGSTGTFLLELHRFPSLNSVGRLRIGISLDEGPVQVIETLSNDEWRGNWKKNVLDNVDRLYLRLSVPNAGMHQLNVWAIDRYFAFSRIVIYTGERKENNLAGVRGKQDLPAIRDWPAWCDQFYGRHRLQPRPECYEAPGECGDCLAQTCRVVQAERSGRQVTPEWYLEQGRHPFEEKGGAVRIDAAAALAQSMWAWTQDGQISHKDGIWRHCSSESYGRSGLAMYIRTPGLCWTPENAPCLNYRFRCEGGRYAVWMLTKFNVREESFFGIGIDERQIPKEELYGNGGLWRYEAEQIYRWVCAARIPLTEGEHTLHVYALASGMRYDRFYLQKFPPVRLDIG